MLPNLVSWSMVSSNLAAGTMKVMTPERIWSLVCGLAWASVPEMNPCSRSTRARTSASFVTNDPELTETGSCACLMTSGPWIVTPGGLGAKSVLPGALPFPVCAGTPVPAPEWLSAGDHACSPQATAAASIAITTRTFFMTTASRYVDLLTHETAAAAVGNNASVLQVRNLAIDVAARRVLSDAAFTVALGDKVGLVGRNGAGKTSLLKVLAGEDDPAAGLVLRRGTLGYVPQNPKPRAEAAQTALSHILSGRALDSAAIRLAELHAKLEKDHSPASVERFSEAEERYRLDGGYSSESDAR